MDHGFDALCFGEPASAPLFLPMFLPTFWQGWIVVFC